MLMDVEKGRMLNASCIWVHFVLRNTDIMTTVNKGPFAVAYVAPGHFEGKIFGVSTKLEALGASEPAPAGEIDIVADVRLPGGLGRTHTVAHYRYRLVDADATMLDLRLTLETSGLLMGVYAALLNKRIDHYLAQVLTHVENAAMLLQARESSLKELLSDQQLHRVNAFRDRSGDTTFVVKEPNPKVLTLGIDTGQRVWDSELSELTNLYKRFGGKAEELERELVRIRDTRDAVATLLIARRMLEVIVAHVCQTSLGRPRGNEPLAMIIDKIAREERVPEYVVTSMNNLNRLSTYGAHPKEFSPRQVREALMALCSIMEWYAGYGDSEKQKSA